MKLMNVLKKESNYIRVCESDFYDSINLIIKFVNKKNINIYEGSCDRVIEVAATESQMRKLMKAFYRNNDIVAVDFKLAEY